MNKSNQVMNFLNEVSMRYPDATSLASGRPDQSFFNMERWVDYRKSFTSYFARNQNLDYGQAEALLCQYGKTSGVINDILSRHLLVDENIVCGHEDIIVTNGCQEALLLLVATLVESDSDVLLTLDPSYIGFSGVVSVLGKKLEAIAMENDAFCVDHFREKIKQLHSKKLTPKAFYINPDFNNPLGICLSEAQRLEILTVCREHNIYVIEDNPYGLFRFSGQAQATIKSLDRDGIVFYLGSFAKTLCPSLRIGYIVCPPKQQALYQSLVSAKSLVSVNTSQLTQSIVGGYLLDNQFSLKERSKNIAQKYEQNKHCIIDVLEAELGGENSIWWNSPQGGFFLTISLPFDFTEDDVKIIAEQYKVICMPVSFFSIIEGAWNNRIRLAFSNISGQELQEAVQRLCSYIQVKLSQNRKGITND